MDKEEKEKKQEKELEQEEKAHAKEEFQVTDFDKDAEYQGIIEQQKALIRERDERIDKLIEQMQSLVNNHGNYHEESKQVYKPVEQHQKPEDDKSLSELDYSI